jgi:hypothetical protein
MELPLPVTSDELKVLARRLDDNYTRLLANHDPELPAALLAAQLVMRDMTNVRVGIVYTPAEVERLERFRQIDQKRALEPCADNEGEAAAES